MLREYSHPQITVSYPTWLGGEPQPELDWCTFNLQKYGCWLNQFCLCGLKGGMELYIRWRSVTESEVSTKPCHHDGGMLNLNTKWIYKANLKILMPSYLASVQSAKEQFASMRKFNSLQHSIPATWCELRSQMEWRHCHPMYTSRGVPRQKVVAISTK